MPHSLHTSGRWAGRSLRRKKVQTADQPTRQGVVIYGDLKSGIPTVGSLKIPAFICHHANVDNSGSVRGLIRSKPHRPPQFQRVPRRWIPALCSRRR